MAYLEIIFTLLFLFLINYNQLWKPFFLIIIIFPYFYYLIKKYLTIKTNIDYKEIKPSIMVILGSGGHTWEMINILSRLKWEQYLPIYIIGYSDLYSLNDITFFEKKFDRAYFSERITRPKENHHHSFSIIVFIRTIYCFFKSFNIICKHRPDYVLSNGPSICVPIILCGWLLKKIGYINTKLVYIESAARVNNLSISGNIVKYFVDDIFGFWTKLSDSLGLKPLNSSEYFIYDKQKKNLNKNKKNDKSVLITVGTTQFKELINLSLTSEFQSELLKKGFSKLTIQIGNYKLNKEVYNHPNLKIEIISFLPSFLFHNLIKNTDLIISHGGAGTLIQSIILGKKPISLPNKYVNDNHQIEIINYLHSKGYIYKSTIENLLDYFSNDYKESIFDKNISFKFELSNIFLASIGQNKIKYFKENIKDSNNSKITIAIPSIYKDIERLNNLLWSIHKFISKDFIDIIYIIVPDNDYNKFTKFTFFESEEITIKEKIIFIRESELVPSNIFSTKKIFLLNNKNGWFKQQILKLAIAFIIKTKFYLILDSDCLFIKPLVFSDLLIKKDNSIISILQEEEIYIHDKWWKGSAKLLGITDSFLDSIKTGIGVTPQILSVDIVKELCNFIESKEQGKWYSILWINRIQIFPSIIWTEYTLYYLFSLRTGILQKYHILKKNSICNYNNSVWELHESFDWNPLKSNQISPIVIFQSNTNLSHLIPKAFISQNKNNNSKDFISCIMFLKKNNLEIYDKNSLLLSINCFISQIWKKENRELIIFCNKENENIIVELINNVKNQNIYSIVIKEKENILKIINKNIKGNYIALWPLISWSSPYRLSIQYNFLKEKKINKCYISPFIKAYPNNGKFIISEGTDIKINNINLKNTLFCQKKYMISDIEAQPLNEPTVFIEINDILLKKDKKCIDAIQFLQKKNSISLFYKLIRLTSPFIYNSSIIPFRTKRRIYIISSELEFIPVIGGINTFLRVILSELIQTKIHLEKSTEFVFIGIQMGKNDYPNLPHIEGIIFKFLSTNKSKNYNSLNNYFKSFRKYSEIFEELQIFGKSAMKWIEEDSNPGDICVSTIIYEFNRSSLEILNKKGIKIIHTVHSLVPIKIINNLKCISLTGLNIKERVFAFIFFKIFRFNEYNFRKIYKFFHLKYLVPEFAQRALDIEEFLMTLSKIIIVPSHKLAKITAKLYYNNKHKIKYIPWGLPEHEIFGEPLIYFKETNLELKKNITKIKCLALCKIIPQKGIDLLLDSFYYIEKINPMLSKRIELNICGDMAYMQEQKFKLFLEEKVKKIKISKIEFKGWLSGEPKREILVNSDLFLLPSLNEPFGFCILEAMKAGLPIVSFDTEGPSDIITNKFGRLVKVSDYETMVKDFASAIIDICQSENYNELRIFSSEAIKQWKIKELIINLLSF